MTCHEIFGRKLRDEKQSSKLFQSVSVNQTSRLQQYGSRQNTVKSRGKCCKLPLKCTFKKCGLYKATFESRFKRMSKLPAFNGI